jgi:ketosteroid isomerase-like protein
MPEWVISETGATPVDMPLEQELYAERQMNELLRESYADLEALYREDVGWRRIGEQKNSLTAEGRKAMAMLADLAVTGNALIKRGTALRTAYVWGQGVTVTVRDDGSDGQDVNAVWSQFWNEPSTR